MDVINFARIDGLYTDYQRRVAEVIKDVYPTVRLIRMEPGHPSFDPQRPFALIDEPNMLAPYHIRNLAESEIDHRLVAWLIDNDMRKAGSQVNKLQLLEMAHAALEAKREEEWRAEKKDMMKSILKSNKNEYRHNGQTLRR
jgi:hypothetical protein